jgi:hypothetical protein
VLTGVEENARSGRRDDTNEPIIEDMVGGESSEISWYVLNIVLSKQAQEGTIVITSPHSRRHSVLSSPTHLAQYFDVRDFSNLMEKRVQFCRIRLVKVGQECEQEQCLERESPRLPPPDYLVPKVSPTPKIRQGTQTEKMAGDRSPRKR